MAESEYLRGLELGGGVNLEQRTLHGRAVAGEIGPALTGVGGLEVEYELNVIRSHEEVATTFAVSGEVSYSGFFSASIAASFLQSSKLSRYRTFVVAKCIVRLPDTILRNVSLTPDAIQTAATLDRGSFVKLYGDSFLSGVRTGGYYFGVIEIESTSSEEQRAIAVAVSGSGWGAHATLSVSERLQRASENLSKRVYTIRRGGSAEVRAPTTADEVIAQATGFAAEVRANPVPVNGIYTRYDDAFAVPYREAPRQFAWDQRQTDIRILGRRYLLLKQLRADFEFVLDHYNDYQLGRGVLFSLAGQGVLRAPLSAAKPALLAQLRPEGESDARTGSASIDPAALGAELRRVSDAIDDVVLNADRCRSGEPYVLPPHYIASVALPELVGKNMELDEIKRSLVPPGTITMWSGPSDAPPDGWLICDGKHGTPDLQGRFVMGASSESRPAPHEMGEPDQHNHAVDPPPSSFATSVDPGHSHALPAPWYGRKLDDGDWTGIDTGGDFINRVQNDGSHGHSVSIDLGEFRTADSSTMNRPKWYALCFIMKT